MKSVSYDILYDFQFIRSSDGITAVLLLGANNCYESVWCGNHVSQKRARSWCCLFNEPALDEATFMAQVQNMTGHTSMHWMRKGQWIDDAALIRWAKRGIKSAADIESIITANASSGAIACSLVVWNGSVRDVVLKEYVSTTEQYDDWIRRAKALRAQWSGRPNLSIFFTVELWERMFHPTIQSVHSTEQKVCIMKKKRYLKMYTESSCVWANCIKDAIQFSVSEAQGVISKSNLFANATLVKAPKETDLYDAVIQFEYGNRKEYVAHVSPRAIRPCFDIKNAWRYRDERAAQRAIEKLSKRVPHLHFSIQHLA